MAAICFVTPAAAKSRGSWTTAASPAVERADGFSATLLADGRLLLAGGSSRSSLAVKQAEIFDPAKGTWAAAAPMSVGRSQDTATLLGDGRVLVTGGAGEQGFHQPLNSSELFDPKANKWTVGAALPAGFHAHTATALKDGRVLIAGGRNAGHAPALAQSWLFDAAKGTWTQAQPLPVGRTEHAATVLSDGKVLVTGGRLAGHDASFKDAAVFDPATAAWTPVPALMNEARAAHTATLLAGGKVLIVGGTKTYIGGRIENVVASAEIYDPRTQQFTPAAKAGGPRLQHSATMLGDGKVLVIAGTRLAGAKIAASAEIFDPGTGGWGAAAKPPRIPGSHMAAALSGAACGSRCGNVLSISGSENGAPFVQQYSADPTRSGDTRPSRVVQIGVAAGAILLIGILLLLIRRRSRTSG